MKSCRIENICVVGGLQEQSALTYMDSCKNKGFWTPNSLQQPTNPLSPPSLCTQESERNGVIFLCLIVRQPNHLGAFLDYYPVFFLEVLPHFSSLFVFQPCAPNGFSQRCTWRCSVITICWVNTWRRCCATGGKGLGALWNSVSISSCTINSAAWLWAGL